MSRETCFKKLTFVLWSRRVCLGSRDRAMKRWVVVLLLLLAACGAEEESAAVLDLEGDPPAPTEESAAPTDDEASLWSNIEKICAAVEAKDLKAIDDITPGPALLRRNEVATPIGIDRIRLERAVQTEYRIAELVGELPDDAQETLDQCGVDAP